MKIRGERWRSFLAIAVLLAGAEEVRATGVLRADLSKLTIRADRDFAANVSADTDCWSGGKGWTTSADGALRFEQYVVRPADQISDLLAARRIAPDANAVEYVVALNREKMGGGGTLRPGIRLTLPAVEQAAWRMKCGAVPKQVTIVPLGDVGGELSSSFGAAYQKVGNMARVHAADTEISATLGRLQLNLEQLEDKTKVAALDEFSRRDVIARLAIADTLITSAYSRGVASADNAKLAGVIQTLTSAQIPTGEGTSSRRPVRVRAIKLSADGASTPLVGKQICYTPGNELVNAAINDRRFDLFCTLRFQQFTTPAFDTDVRTGKSVFWIVEPTTERRLSCFLFRVIEPNTAVEEFDMGTAADSSGGADTTTCDNNLRRQVRSEYGLPDKRE